MCIKNFRKYILCIYALFANVILYAQQIDALKIKTSAKENSTATFRCRVPAQYNQSSKVKYRLLVYFGGRNTTGEHEVKNPSWTNWCDKNGVFLIVPSHKNDNYWEPQKWSGKALLEAILPNSKRNTPIFATTNSCFTGIRQGRSVATSSLLGFPQRRGHTSRTLAGYSTSRAIK